MDRPSVSSYEVFLSHSSKDKTWADAACAVLEGRRIRCWVAPRDIVPGTEWGASIIKGIDSCRAMVLILSADSNASPQVRREVERAISKGLAVLPFRVEDVLPDGALEYAIGNTHWLDAFSPPVEHKMELLADSVEALLGRPVSKPSASPAPGGDDSEIDEDDEDDDYESEDEPSGRPAATTWVVGVVVVLALLAGVAGLAAFAGRDRSAGSSTVDDDGTDPSGAAEGDAIDLLATIRPMRDRRSGIWTREESGAIVSTGDPNNPKHADVIQIPYVPTTVSYRLELTVVALERPGGVSDFQVGLLVPRGHCAAVFGGWGGRISGLSLVDGKAADANPTRHEAAIFTPGKHEIVIALLFDGPRNPWRIRIGVDGERFLGWNGMPRQLSIGEDFGTDRNAFFLAAFDRKFRVEKFQLVPLGPTFDSIQSGRAGGRRGTQAGGR